MITIEGEDVGSTLIAWVRDWLDLLAADRAADACACLDEPNVYGMRWSPADLQELLENTFGPGTHFRKAHPDGPRFTPVATAVGNARQAFGSYNDGSGYWVEHDVALNGEFSDLTAQFEFRWRGERVLATGLHDLHVL